MKPSRSDAVAGTVLKHCHPLHTDNSQVRALLEGLDAEAAVMQEGVENLRIQLAEANARLSVVTEARVALRKLLPGGERPPLIVVAPDPIPAAETHDDDDDEAQSPAPG